MRSFAHFALFRLAPRWPELGCQVRVRRAGGSSGLLEVRTTAVATLQVALAEPEELGLDADLAGPEELGPEDPDQAELEALGLAVDQSGQTESDPADLAEPAPTVLAERTQADLADQAARHPAPAFHRAPGPA